MGQRARSSALAVLGGLVVLLGAGAARASAAWLTPAIVSAAGCDCVSPAAATDAAGDLTAAFVDDDQGLMVARHQAGGTWSSAVVVGPPAGSPADPVMAGNARGDSVLAYESRGDVDAIVDTAGEPWSAASSSPVSTGGAQTAPSVAIDDQGDALVAWETPASGGLYSIDTAYRPEGGAWQPAVTVDDDAVENVVPSVAFAAGGEATLVWATENGADEAVASATMTAGGSWTSPVQLGTDTIFYTVQVVLDASGEATAAWTSYDGSEYPIGVAERPAGGDWHADGNLVSGATSNNVDPILGFDLAVNAAGRAALVWGFDAGQTDEIAAAVRPAGGAWGAPDTVAMISSPDYIVDPQVVVAADGTVTADWGVDPDGSDTGAVWAASEPPGATWSTPTAISPPIVHDLGCVTLVDPAGDVDVLASLFNGVVWPVWSIVDDAGGPNLDGLVVPAEGTVGVPVNFAVTAIDAWSAIFATQWSFGDGTTGTDELVSHVYDAPGTYTVKTSSSDVLGNTTSQSSTIVIVPAPAIATGTPSGTGPSPFTQLTLQITQAHHRWTETARSARERRVAVGTHFDLTVNQPARVTLTFNQTLRGRRLHGSCRPIDTSGRNEPRCVREVLIGALSIQIPAPGQRRIKFAGRLGARDLRPGSYTVTVRATGSGGSATRRLSFTILA